MDVIAVPEAAIAALDPVRARLPTWSRPRPSVPPRHSRTPSGAPTASPGPTSRRWRAALREVGVLLRRSQDTGSPVQALALDAEITFATPDARADFARDLTEAVNAVIARHHDERSGGGRRHRLLVGAYPIPEEQPHG